MPAYAPARYDIVLIQGADFFVPIRPKLADHSLLDTTGYTARMMVRTSIDDANPVLSFTTGGGTLEIGFDPPKFIISTAYALGAQVVPKTALNGFIYQVTTAGTTAGSEPVWPTTVGGTVASNTVVFTNVGSDANVSSVRINLPASVTVGLADFGHALYDLELIDTFSHVTRLLYGNCTLSREVTR